MHKVLIANILLIGWFISSVCVCVFVWTSHRGTPPVCVCMDFSSWYTSSVCLYGLLIVVHLQCVFFKTLFKGREDHFQKKNCPKRTFPSNFVKLVSKILYLFLAEKMVVCCCLLFVVCCCLLQLIVRFWLTFFFKTLFKGKNFAVE